jgi:hypothetical protein
MPTREERIAGGMYGLLIGDELVVRRQSFSEDTGLIVEPRLDGRGSPLCIEED